LGDITCFEDVCINQKRELYMTGNLSQDWIVYVLLAGAIIWVGFMIFSGGKKKKDNSSAGKDDKAK